MATSGRILALDVGDARIGVASAHNEVRIASPLTTIANDVGVIGALRALCSEQEATEVVIGLPRNLSGDDTPQTQVARTFAAQLAERLDLPIYLQDEALTSVKAREELERRGRPYEKGDIDALAATYILEDYLRNTQEGNV